MTLSAKNLLLTMLFILITGCAHYTYYGVIEAEDSEEAVRQHLMYWTKSERKLWFDETSGTIWLLTECSLSTIAFGETADGIIFRCTPNDEGVLHTVQLHARCGEILGVDKIKNLGDEPLRLRIYCRFLAEDFTVDNHAYLKPRQEPYEFQVIRKRSSEFPDGAPKRPPCRERGAI